jgi:hypothetical protein
MAVVRSNARSRTDSLTFLILKCSETAHGSLRRLRKTEAIATRAAERLLIAQPFVTRPPSPHPCPKCGSDRIRPLAAEPPVYFRCDACGYLVRPREERTDKARVLPQLPHLCPKCGSHQTRIVGQSDDPPLVHGQCNACGRIFSRELHDPKPPQAVSKRERSG